MRILHPTKITSKGLPYTLFIQFKTEGLTISAMRYREQFRVWGGGTLCPLVWRPLDMVWGPATLIQCIWFKYTGGPNFVSVPQLLEATKLKNSFLALAYQFLIRCKKCILRRLILFVTLSLFQQYIWSLIVIFHS